MHRDGDDYLAMYPRYLRWINQCLSCRRKGYKPHMPLDLQPNIQRLFTPLSLGPDGLCEQCATAKSSN